MGLTHIIMHLHRLESIVDHCLKKEIFNVFKIIYSTADKSAMTEKAASHQEICCENFSYAECFVFGKW